MITADTLQTLTTFSSGALSKALSVCGHEGMKFSGCKFLGLTNGGQFCYRVEYFEEDQRGATSGKVFLTYNPAEGKVIADIS